jgi:pantetheine-phosphate adenylyltransferase
MTCNTPSEDLREKRTALFAGSFDPFTIGHKSIVDRSLSLFDEIVIGVGINAAKKGSADAAERVVAIERLYAGEPKVRVIQFDCLTVQAAARCGARWLLRGVRSVADFEYERTLADINRNISGLESVLILAEPHLASVSSSVVRELASYGEDVSRFIPQPPRS